jgi:hypothetical protein
MQNSEKKYKILTITYMLQYQSVNFFNKKYKQIRFIEPIKINMIYIYHINIYALKLHSTIVALATKLFPTWILV